MKPFNPWYHRPAAQVRIRTEFPFHNPIPLFGLVIQKEAVYSISPWVSRRPVIVARLPHSHVHRCLLGVFVDVCVEVIGSVRTHVLRCLTCLCVFMSCL